MENVRSFFRIFLTLTNNGRTTMKRVGYERENLSFTADEMSSNEVKGDI